MADYIYIDNSNLYIEGRRVSAVQQRLATNINEAMRDGILDHGYTISFGKLHEFLTGGILQRSSVPLCMALVHRPMTQSGNPLSGRVSNFT